MFRSRLQLLLAGFVICWICMVCRLFWLQVIAAEEHREKAEARLTLGKRSLSAIRGTILDRRGQLLACDEPRWSLALHYQFLNGDPDYHKQLTRVVMHRYGLEADEMHIAEEELARQGAALWEWLASWSGESVETLDERASRVVAQIARWTRRTTTTKFREEYVCHPLVKDLDHRMHIAARLELMEVHALMHDLGVVELLNETRRTYRDCTAAAHLVGTMTEVDRETVATMPYRRGGSLQERAGYSRGDRMGVSGVEALLEPDLRGVRGSLTTYRDGRPADRTDPTNGTDVHLTVDMALQRTLYDMLAEHVERNRDIPGGSIVVLDVESRDALAVVSYPAFDPNTHASEYEALSSDFVGLPLHPRAYRSQYAPGSIVKPITIMAAHSAGLITPDTHISCNGRLFPDHEMPGCWRPAGSTHRQAHGPLTSEQALMGSCNIFCFTVAKKFCDQFGGARHGIQEMTAWLREFGIGQRHGLGINGERFGILPTPDYLDQRGHTPTVGAARNYSIGQGELQVTPVQAANIVATYASGIYRPPTILRDADPRPAVALRASQETWNIVKRGMYGVVNDPRGTARHAKLRLDDYVLCGKSGSAQTPRWNTAFDVTFTVDEVTVTERIAASRSAAARANVQAEHPEAQIEQVLVAEKWPPIQGTDVDENRFSHAWFVGFIQPAKSGRPEWRKPAHLAIAVLLEFGGSGGTVAGPLCRDVALRIVEQFPEYLDPGNDLVAR